MTTTNSSSSSSSSSDAAALGTVSSSSSSKKWGVDVLKLSDALSGDVHVTVLLVNAPSLDGVKVPDLPAVADGMYDTLTRVQVRLIAVDRMGVGAGGGGGGGGSGSDRGNVCIFQRGQMSPA
jgi:hypothetical protein